MPTSSLVDLPEGVSLGERIFVADFYQGWPTENFPSVKMTLKDGQYVFEIGPQDAGIRSTGVVNARNLYHQIEFVHSNCPDGAGFGLRIRQKDSSSYYRFSVYCDGTFKTAVVVGGTVTEMTAGSLPEGVDPSSPGVHTIGIAAFGSGFTYTIDKKLVGTASDSQLTEGDVGFYAFSQGAEVLNVAFDNWQVWTLR